MFPLPLHKSADVQVVAVIPLDYRIEVSAANYSDPARIFSNKASIADYASYNVCPSRSMRIVFDIISLY